jgi:tetratricopeptide (TPR) repeat protein
MASIPEKHFDDISVAYRRLGENYLHSKVYLKAADAFSMAVKFSEKPENYPDLYFMIGESYLRGNVLDMAEEAYRDIISIGNPFWTKLAQEKIRCMELEKKLKRA